MRVWHLCKTNSLSVKLLNLWMSSKDKLMEMHLQAKQCGVDHVRGVVTFHMNGSNVSRIEKNEK